MKMACDDVDRAIHQLCVRFEWHERVEILIVGGSAGMLTGLLARDRVTGDCDVCHYDPSHGKAWVEVEITADLIGAELQLPTNWLNSNVKIREDSLPDGWRDRRVLIEQGNWIHVYAISRPDLIAMKFLAGRPQDLEDLEELGVENDDITFTEQYLESLSVKGTCSSEIANARELVNSWIKK